MRLLRLVPGVYGQRRKVTLRKMIWRHPLAQRPIAPTASALSSKKIWTSPAIRTVEMKAAQGLSAGPKCDKYGSLSHGSGC